MTLRHRLSRQSPQYAATALFVAVIGAGVARAALPGDIIVFAPHRAVYDVKLLRAAPGSGVNDMSGRLVYELTGSACEGYTQTMRFVTQSSAPDGSEQVNDMRSTSFEEAAGRRLRFDSTQYRDEQVAEVTQGQAGRRGADGTVNVELVKPEPRALSLPATVYFPIQHSIAMLEAAKAGKKLFVADVYDGSEKGDKVSATNTVISPVQAPANDKLPPGLANADRLKSLKYWSIATSYFEKDKSSDKKDALPNYEMAAHFYENGVSTKLIMDYGDFSLAGELTELTFLDQPTCAGAK